MKRKEKSADQQRYDELLIEAYVWDYRGYGPDDPRKVEMERKREEMDALFKKLYHPEKKRGWFW